jgi:hypothetical protein
MASVGKFLLGYQSSSLAVTDKALPRDLEAVERLFDDELEKARDGSSYSTRNDFLARFARVIQHYDLVQPTPVSPPPPQEAPAKGRSKVAVAAAQSKSGTLQPIGKKQDLKPEPARAPITALTQGVAATEEKPTIGFAELLFQAGGGGNTETPFSPLGAAWGKGASEAFSSGEVGGWGTDQPDNSPFWLKATVFLAGSLLGGFLLAQFSGHALWQHHKQPAPLPAAAAVSGNR